MSFRILGLDPAPFRPLRGLDDAELRAKGARRIVAQPGETLPDRIALRDAEPGEAILLLNYVHQPADTPFRSGHAIFVLEEADEPATFVDAVPPALRTRTLSLRAFDADHEMVDADLVDGGEAETLIERLFARPHTAYIQAHYARRGCYAARIERA